jgi:plastocyanin
VRFLLVAGFFLAALVPAATADETPVKLVGVVGPGFTIDLQYPDGTHVQSLRSGKYEVLVHDLSDEHNFVLGSKTANTRIFQTEVPFVGDMTFTVDLPAGLYAYACSPHFQVMNGAFTVTDAQPPPTTTTKALTGKVDARTASLSQKTAAPGRYRITVNDRSKTRNFHLVGPGVNKSTGKAFMGRTTWTVQLRAGSYRYGADPKLTGRLVVS